MLLARRPEMMKAWERTPLACFFSAAKPARQRRALPGHFRRNAHVQTHATKNENETAEIAQTAESYFFLCALCALCGYLHRSCSCR
jgi:hypothetical protein